MLCELVLCLTLVFTNGPDLEPVTRTYPAQFVRDARKVRYWETYGIPESRKASAISPTGDWCSLQINRRWHEWRLTRKGLSWYAILAPEHCWDTAYEIWRDSGNSFRQWSTRVMAGVR